MTLADAIKKDRDEHQVRDMKGKVKVTYEDKLRRRNQLMAENVPILELDEIMEKVY